MRAALQQAREKIIAVYTCHSSLTEKLLDEADDLLCAAIREAEQQPGDCRWTPQNDDNMPDTYATSCGELWSFIDGGPVENNVRFCHGCGKSVEVVKQPHTDHPLRHFDRTCPACVKGEA